MQKKRGGWGFACAILASGIAGALFAASALAAAVVADVEGDVRVADSGAPSRALVPGQRVDSGSVVTTAGGARLILRFDDGQWAALHENTELRIREFHFEPREPAADRALFELLRGVLRVVTGTLGHRNPEAFELRAPSMIVGVRGTDFMVAAGATTYLRVLQGTVVASNAGGRATFGAGDLGAAAEDARPAAAIAGDALPAAVAAAFGTLGARRLAPSVPDAAGERPHGAGEGLGQNRGKEDMNAPRGRGRDLAPKGRPK